MSTRGIKDVQFRAVVRMLDKDRDNGTARYYIEIPEGCNPLIESYGWGTNYLLHVTLSNEGQTEDEEFIEEFTNSTTFRGDGKWRER